MDVNLFRVYISPYIHSYCGVGMDKIYAPRKNEIKPRASESINCLQQGNEMEAVEVNGVY